MKYTIALGLVFLVGCVDVLDAQWFNGLALEEYALPNNEIPAELIEEVELTGTVTDDEPAPTLVGIWTHQPPGVGRDDVTVLYFHGNAESIDFYWDRVQILWRMGFPVFAIDYRGYGRSSGVATEAGFYADGRTALQHVVSRLDGDDRLLTYGFSIGTTVAVDVSREFPPDALIIEAGVGSGQAFVDDTIGAGFDLSVVMDTNFDNLGKIGDVAGPKLMMHGRNDDFIRFEFGEALFDAAREPKTFLPTEGTHGSVPCPDNGEERPEVAPCVESAEYETAVNDFVDEVLR